MQSTDAWGGHYPSPITRKLLADISSKHRLPEINSTRKDRPAIDNSRPPGNSRNHPRRRP